MPRSVRDVLREVLQAHDLAICGLELDQRIDDILQRLHANCLALGSGEIMALAYLILNKGSSMLDVQLECQDLERISIVNRLGRFHVRNHHAAQVEASSTDLGLRRIYPDRHVMPFAVPGNLPEAWPSS
ncbi:hypothetical protein GUJ93_ZPchr0010g9260 [Zizania palustris]|uniref:Uncharacterized protein n=1 Tax=Zizania palustris TaxID=103762 RepID=A0A8J5WCP7_ZIZPA|nr:hypothetical protein GUJ93_ZPchr0010g9260 [Zizania palustris]